MQQNNTPGLSVAVAIDGKVVWSKGYGFTDVEEKIPVTTDTLFQVVSLSKPIAAVRALLLAEEGKINLAYIRHLCSGDPSGTVSG